MPGHTASAVIRLKLLMFCCSLAAMDLITANLNTLQQQLAVLTMLLRP